MLTDTAPDTSLFYQNEEPDNSNNETYSNSGTTTNTLGNQVSGAIGNNSSLAFENSGTGLANTNGSVQTSDMRTAFAAASLISLSLTVIIRKKR